MQVSGWGNTLRILHRCPKIHLADHSSIATLANTFSSFFINKISVNRSSFLSDSYSCVLNPPDTRKVLQNLSCVSADEVRHLVLRSPCKTSAVDPIPTSLVKDCFDIITTPMTFIINLSLTEGSFNSHFKSAHVSPLSKKPSLNKNSMKNYRPVSNLRFLSKVIEKVVVNQLNTHINSSNTSNQYQSAYRKFHSTETALLKIHSDIPASMGACRVTALMLLDLSAAIDNIDHTILLAGFESRLVLLCKALYHTCFICGQRCKWWSRLPKQISSVISDVKPIIYIYLHLLNRLDDWFGVTGKALNWFKSYLTGRCRRIKIGDCLSSKADLKFGVLQGSVLGPLLFTLYTTPLSSMIFEHAIPHHLDANDSQLHVSFASGDSAAALNGLQSCLASVQSWMSTNKVKLNPDKTHSSLMGTNDSGANTSVCFQLSFSVSKLTLPNLLVISV